MPASRASGVVKWFNEQKGYGFIVPADGGDDLFCHATALPSGISGLKDGVKVTFETVSGREGKKKAANVQIA